jgi:hypothetical protein
LCANAPTPGQKKAKVTVTELSADFEARLIYPTAAPASFNSDQLAFNAGMTRNSQPPPDSSPRQYYTPDITIEEMKRQIKTHGLDTAMGVDGFSYQAIPNDKLLEFFLYCLKNQVKTCLASG